MVGARLRPRRALAGKSVKAIYPERASLEEGESKLPIARESEGSLSFAGLH